MKDLPPIEDPGEIELIGQRPPRSPRGRATRAALVLLALALALTLPLGGLAALRERAVALLHPTPTPWSLPGADRFYFEPLPPWVTVLLDGRPLHAPPLAGGAAPPLRLARGTHHIEWRGAPFQTPHCALVAPVPLIYSPRPGACDIRPYQGGPAGYVLQYSESLAALLPSQQTALQGAIQDGLRAASVTAEMPAGRPYLVLQPETPSGFQLATAPTALRATLTFTFDINSRVTEPCMETGGTIQPCRFPDQDCRLLCTVPPASANDAAWVVALPAHAEWTLTAPSGAPAGTAAGGPFGSELLLVMRVVWSDAGWHAVPVFGHSMGALGDDAVCGPARDWLARGAALLGLSVGPVVPGGPTLTGEVEGSVRYASGGDPTDGCAVSVPLGALAFAPGPAVTQPMVFLLRFGMLLAVNDAARQVAPQLPVANAAERAIAYGLLPQG